MTTTTKRKKPAGHNRRRELLLKQEGEIKRAARDADLRAFYEAAGRHARIDHDTKRGLAARFDVTPYTARVRLTQKGWAVEGHGLASVLVRPTGWDVDAAMGDA